MAQCSPCLSLNRRGSKTPHMQALDLNMRTIPTDSHAQQRGVFEIYNLGAGAVCDIGARQQICPTRCARGPRAWRDGCGSRRPIRSTISPRQFRLRTVKCRQQLGNDTEGAELVDQVLDVVRREVERWTACRASKSLTRLAAALAPAWVRC